MKKVQRLLSVLLVCCMVVGLLPLTAYALEFGGSENNVTWRSVDGIMTFSGTGPMVDYTSLSQNADSFGYRRGYFRNNTKSIAVTGDITRIGDFAFAGYSQITSVTITDSLTSIGKNAFYNCVLLKSISIPAGVNSIGSSAFEGCTNLVDIIYGGTEAEWIAAIGTSTHVVPAGTTVHFGGTINSTPFAGGDGTAVAPYQIASVRQLDAMRNYPSAHFVLVNDIDLLGFYTGVWEPIGSQAEPYTGTLDGAGYSIKNMNLVQGTYFERDVAMMTEARCVGLFGYVSHANIKNLNIEIASCDAAVGCAYVYLGGLAGYATESEIDSIRVSGQILKASPGSAGWAYHGGEVGGIVGRADKTTITNSHNSCDTTIDSNLYEAYAGGITGFGGEISFSSNSGNISTNGDKSYSGGISGSGAIVRESYNLGNITADKADRYSSTYAGGILGNAGNAIDCYNIGRIGDATYSGGIYGKDTTVTSCYSIADLEKNGTSGIEYFISGVSTALTEEDMKNQSSFAGFDFDAIWTMGNTKEYPYPELKNNRYTTSNSGFDGFRISPESNSYYIRTNALEIIFDSNVEIGYGKVWLKDLSTHATIQEIDINNRNCVWPDDEKTNVIHLGNLFGNKEPFGPRNQSFYLEFESGTIVNLQTGKSYGVISTEKMWHMNTLPAQSWGFENPKSEIGTEAYFRVFPAQYALAIKNWDHMFKNDGQKGHCYGMASTAGSITMGFPAFSSFTPEGSWSLSTASKNSQSTQILGKTAQEFIDIGHVMQMLPERLLEKTFNTNLDKLCAAVKAFQEGKGDPVVISLKGSGGGHAILASGIRESENECEIIAYDSNFPFCIVVIKLEKENGKYITWQVSCPDNESYTNDTLAKLNEKITYSLPGKDAYVQLLATEPASIVGYNLLQSMMKDFDIANQDGESANVVAGEVERVTANEFLIPIQTDNGLSNVQSANMQLLSWVSDQSPICIKGVDSAISETSLIGNDSDVKIATNADTEITLSLSAWEKGGNQIQLDLKSPNPVVVSNHYVNYPISGKTKEYSLQIEGNANSWVIVSESAHGTKVQGLTNADITAKLDNAERKFNIETLVDTNAVYISLKDVDDAVIVEINADTTGDGLPDVTLNRGLLSGSLQTTYNVAFDANGGTVNAVTMTTGEDGKLSNLPSPVRTNYTFDGWYTAITGGTKVTTDTLFSNDSTIYAHWSWAGGGSGSGTGSGSGFGGGYTPTANPITVPAFNGGSVAVSPTTASNGGTVTITTVPDYGYELSSLVVTDKSGKEIALTDKGNGVFTFTMPNSKVSINAVFQKIEAAWNNPFTDVTEGTWYYDAVKFANKNSLMNGIGNGRFAPNANLSRAMLAQILYNKEGTPGVSNTSVFADVASGTWYTNAVAWASANGIVNGYGNGRFGPNNNITREQLAVMLWRYAGKPAATAKGLRFSDANKASEYALEALYWAVENGIINGKGGGILAPTGQATRAEAAQMLKNFMEK